jgi:hypothetical protein
MVEIIFNMQYKPMLIILRKSRKKVGVLVSDVRRYKLL